MNDLFNIVCLLIAIAILLVVAFPDRFLPSKPKKKKKVGSTYWGAYEGAPPDEPEEEKTIQVEHPARKEKVIGGSYMYHIGRGTSFRQ
jgi:hypothetical protein